LQNHFMQGIFCMRIIDKFEGHTNAVTMNTVGSRIVLLFFCLTIPKTSYAKIEYLPGYIIDFHNDTIRGFVNYEEWSCNPDEIGFKPGKMRSTAYYQPKDIAGFGVVGKQYVSAIVQKEVSPFRDSELERNPDLRLVADTVFLQTLVGGEKSLYYFKDLDEKENFYIKEDSVYTLLQHKIYVEYVNNFRKEYHNMRYIGQLTRYFWDDPSILAEIADSYYSRSSLENLFRLYLKQENTKPVYINTDSKVATEFGAVAGASITMLQVETEYFKAGFGPSVNFTGGLYADLSMRGKLHDWSMYNELLYSSYRTSNYVGFYFPNSRAVFDYHYLKLNSMVRIKPSWFFLNVGISNGICLHHFSTEFAEIRSYEIGLLLGAGIKIKNYTLECREDLGDGMSPYVYIGSETHRFQILFGYSF